MKIRNLQQLYEILPENEQVILDVLRSIVIDTLPDYCQEKISFSVPYFYGKKGICLIWPSTVPRGGIKEGVLLGFWQGHLLADVDQYLTHGTNKKIFYKVFKSVEEIDVDAVVKLLYDAVAVDNI